MAMGEADKVRQTIEHELCTTRFALALYDFLPHGKQRSLEMQYPDFRSKIEIGGTHHDFGKKSWPAELLCSARHPTRDEWYDWIIPHPEVSANSFNKQIGADSVIEAMILYHHVRYDGRAVEDITPDGRRVPDYAGYPKGPSGEDIPFAARILKLCDAVASMVENRPYRQRVITPAEAIRQVAERGGTEYDPMLAALFSLTFTPRRIIKLADGKQN